MLVENVLSGTLIAPIRAAASHATANSGPFGWRMAIRVPRPDPPASSPAPDQLSAAPPRHMSRSRRRRRGSTWSGCSAARARSNAGMVSGSSSPASITGDVTESPRRGDTSGSAARSPAMASTSASHSTRSPASSLPRSIGSCPSSDRSIDGEEQGRQQRHGPAVTKRQRRGLAGDTDIAVVVLHHAVEEDGEEAAVHDARVGLRRQWERSPSRWAVAVDLDVVLGKARVERPDVPGVVDVRRARRPTPRHRPGVPGSGGTRRLRDSSTRRSATRRWSTSSSSCSRARRSAVTRRMSAAALTAWGNGSTPKVQRSTQRPFGHAEDPLGDEVALDLGGAGGDGVLERPEVVAHDPSVAAVGPGGAERPSTEQLHAEPGDLQTELAVPELHRRSEGRRQSCRLRVRHAALRHPPQGVDAGVEPPDAAPQAGIVPAGAGQGHRTAGVAPAR